MEKKILNIVLLVLLSFPNILAFLYDPSLTKLAGVLIPAILFVGLGRLIGSFKNKVLFSLPLLLLSFVTASVFIQFNLQVTEGVIEVVISSDPAEGFEFVKEASVYLYWLLGFYLVSITFLYKRAKVLQETTESKSYLYGLLSLFMLLLPIADMLGKGASSRSHPLSFVRSSYFYIQEKIIINKMVEGRKDFQFNASLVSADDETIIFVIGETSRRDYYSIYGYDKETTPRLAKEEGIILFQDAISPSNATIRSLRAVLHLSTADDDSLFYKTKSIVSLAKEAGYKTWWLSNQSRFGKNETSIASSTADVDIKTFLNQAKTFERGFDDELLPLFENSLTDSADHKFIVMHFYGSHISYNSRYKKEFSLFQGIPKGYEKHPKEIQRKVNEYANSIAFSDYVLSEIINKSKEKNKAICMVYMSDHGEYLADKLDNPYMGHGSNPPYKVEVEVPLIVWCSDKYKKSYAKKWQSIVNNKLAPINLQDMFYSLSDLMHIDYALMKPERSFFNEKYKPLLPRSVLSATSGKLFKYNDLKQ